MRTPLIIRKHLRSPERLARVSRTSLGVFRRWTWRIRWGGGDKEGVKYDRRTLQWYGASSSKARSRFKKIANDDQTYLCSSASCSTSPIFWASCCRLLLYVEYWFCSSIMRLVKLFYQETERSYLPCCFLAVICCDAMFVFPDLLQKMFRASRHAPAFADQSRNLFLSQIISTRTQP